MATNVFVSYRRDDTRDFAGRLAERLRATPEIGDIFIDVDAIEPGADFEVKIERALQRSQACLVVIGPNWIGRTAGSAARIDDDRDFVRLEVRRALSRGVRIVPVLANGAVMPDAGDLPEDVRGLTRIHGVSVRHESFDRDAAYLTDAILGRVTPAGPRGFLMRHPMAATLVRAGAGFVSGLVVLFVTVAVVNAITGKPLEAIVGGRGMEYVLVALVLAAATAAPSLLRRR